MSQTPNALPPGTYITQRGRERLIDECEQVFEALELYTSSLNVLIQNFRRDFSLSLGALSDPFIACFPFLNIERDENSLEILPFPPLDFQSMRDHLRLILRLPRGKVDGYNSFRRVVISVCASLSKIFVTYKSIFEGIGVMLAQKVQANQTISEILSRSLIRLQMRIARLEVELANADDATRKIPIIPNDEIKVEPISLYAELINSDPSLPICPLCEKPCVHCYPPLIAPASSSDQREAEEERN